MTEITEQELADARKIWGDALIAISKGLRKKALMRPERLLMVRWMPPMAFTLGRFFSSQR